MRLTRRATGIMSQFRSQLECMNLPIMKITRARLFSEANVAFYDKVAGYQQTAVQRITGIKHANRNQPSHTGNKLPHHQF